jgi:hypothetical protein
LNEQKPDIMRKLFSIFFLMVIAASGVAQETHFDFSFTNSTGYDIYYRIVDGDRHLVEVTYPCQHGDSYWWGYIKPEGKLILADTVSYNGLDYTVVAIGDHAFCGCTGLRGVLKLPQTTTAIGEGAFKGCSNLNGNLNIPSMVTHIGDEAFCDCSKLTGQLYLSDSLTFIGDKAFAQCGFSGRIMLPATLETIGTAAFKGLSDISSICTKAVLPPTTNESAFEGISRWIHLNVPYNTTEAYQNAPGWSRFNQRTYERSIWNGTAIPWTKGSGTHDDPYLIESAENLAWLSTSVNQALNISIDTINGPENIRRIDTIYHDVLVYQDTYFKLVIDVDLQKDYGLLWEPIGNKHYENNKDYCTYFCGHFDGDNHRIRDFNINVPITYPITVKTYYYGLFGIVKNGSLSNLDLHHLVIDVQGQFNKSIGGLVGKAINSQLVNCYSRGEWLNGGHSDDFGVSRLYNSSVGGIVGVAENCLIEECSAKGSFRMVNGSSSTGKNGIGGVVGVFLCDEQHNENNRISGCSFTGKIEAHGFMSEADGGGIVGLCASLSEGSGTIKLEKCFSQGMMLGDCFHWNEPKMISTGGIVGCVLDIDTLSVLNCFSNDSLPANADDPESYAGGIIGKAHPNTTLFVKNCYHTGTIRSFNSGGIVVQNTNMTLVRNCYFDESVAPDDGFGIPLDSNYMKSAAFVNQLNSGSSLFMMDHEPFVNDGYPIFGTDGLVFVGAEWYYEIVNGDGNIAYQHLQCTGDTTVNSKKAKVIVRTNHIYDKRESVEVTRECVYEENGVIYWWNNTLGKFTVLYDFGAEEGDEWTIEVGNETITTHVYETEIQYIDSIPYKRLTIADPNDDFSGNLLSSIGHQTSFFPERLMNKSKGYRVEGLRCYWLDENLVYKIGNEDCDAIYADLHHGLDEQTDDVMFTVYPNPTQNVLFVETCHGASLSDQTYRITNLFGQILMQGHITGEIQQINIERLPAGMYFVIFMDETRKFVVDK